MYQILYVSGCEPVPKLLYRIAFAVFQLDILARVELPHKGISALALSRRWLYLIVPTSIEVMLFAWKRFRSLYNEIIEKGCPQTLL